AAAACAACNSPCTEATCPKVKKLNVCVKGRNGAPMVTLPVKPCATSLVKKPDSCRRRCSKEKKKNVRSLASGPPSVAPYCARVKGGFLFGSLSMIGANGLRA